MCYWGFLLSQSAAAHFLFLKRKFSPCQVFDKKDVIDFKFPAKFQRNAVGFFVFYLPSRKCILESNTSMPTLIENSTKSARNFRSKFLWEGFHRFSRSASAALCCKFSQTRPSTGYRQLIFVQVYSEKKSIFRVILEIRWIFWQSIGKLCIELSINKQTSTNTQQTVVEPLILFVESCWINSWT